MKDSYIKGAPMPKTIGRCADLYAEVRELRLAMQKEVDEVAKREAEIREHIIANLSKSDDTGASGLRYRAQVKTKTKPRAADWERVFDFIAENDRFDLLQRRLSDRAVMDMLEEGEKIPGIEQVHIPEVSITKLR